MSDIAKKYLKQTTNKYAFVLKEDKYPIREWISTGNLALNALISSDINKGFPTGRVMQFAGPPSVGKTYLAIECMKQAQAKGYTIFYYDTEGGAGDADALITRGIDPELFIHIPVEKVSDLKTDIVVFLESVTKKDKVLIVIDSIGNLVSSKEYADTREGKDITDMTRAKEIKALFRTLIMPAMKSNVPVIAVNHTYSTLDTFSKEVVAGGKGIEYNSSIIITMTKSKEEESSAIIGSGARCMSYKNRFAKEKMVVRLVINYTHGLSKYSGLYDLGEHLGYIITPKKGWRAYKNSSDAQTFVPYSKEDEKKKLPKPENKGWVTGKRESDFSSANPHIWDEMFKCGFEKDIKNLFMYQPATDGIFDDSDIKEIKDDVQARIQESEEDEISD